MQFSNLRGLTPSTMINAIIRLANPATLYIRTHTALIVELNVSGCHIASIRSLVSLEGHGNSDVLSRFRVVMEHFINGRATGRQRIDHKTKHLKNILCTESVNFRPNVFSHG